VHATGWDQKHTEVAFEQHMAQARQLRAARIKAFSQFTCDCVVRTTDGKTLIRSITPDGVPYWQASSQRLYDADVNPATLTLIAPRDDQEDGLVAVVASRQGPEVVHDSGAVGDGCTAIFPIHSAYINGPAGRPVGLRCREARPGRPRGFPYPWTRL
jgi:hypothetical protein